MSFTFQMPKKKRGERKYIVLRLSKILTDLVKGKINEAKTDRIKGD